MNISKIPFLRPSMLAGFVILAAVGCGTPKIKSKPWNLSITKTTKASIQIDLIGVTEADKPYWAGYDLNKYWKSGDLRRRQADKLSKDLLSNESWAVDRADEKWKDWLNRGATELLVIANLPGEFDSGPADPRRIFVSLDKKTWESKTETLDIEVQDTLLRVLTKQTPRK